MANTNMSKVSHSRRKLLLLGGIAVFAISLGFVLRDVANFDLLSTNREWLLAFRDSHFELVTLAFVMSYILIVAFSLPGATIASVTGGFLFGLPLGMALNVLAATLGASAIFVAARWGLGDALARRLNVSEGRLGMLKRRLAENEVSVLLLLRLVPAVPFFIANLLPALVGVRFFNYVWTTALGILPGALVFTWIGVGAGEVFDRGKTPDLSVFWSPQVIGPLLALSTLATLPMIIRLVRGQKDI